MNSRSKDEDLSGTEQVRLYLDKRIISHFEAQADALGVKLTTLLQLIIGEKYNQSRVKKNDSI